MWIVSVLLTAGLAVRFLQLRLARHYRWMLIYLLASALRQLALWPFPTTSVQYMYGWLTTEVVLTALRMLVAAECFRLMTSLFPRLGSFGIRSFYAIGAVAVAITLVVSFREGAAAQWERQAFRCVFLTRQVLLVLASIFLFAAIVTSRFLRAAVAPNIRIHLNLSLAYFLSLALMQMIGYRGNQLFVIPMSVGQVTIPAALFAWWMLALRANGQTIKEPVPNSEHVFRGDRGLRRV
jgi:hypothetical protein